MKGDRKGVDTVTCGEDPEGTDTDVVSADPDDVVAEDCETVKRSSSGKGHGKGKGKSKGHDKG